MKMMFSRTLAAMALLAISVTGVPLTLHTAGDSEEFLPVEGYVHERAKLNDAPVIGIFAQPNDKGIQYIAASYVKWIELAGGRVVPIPYNGTNDEMDKIFNNINGLLLPGGGAEVSAGATYIVKKAIQANDDGDYFPVWGTCLGHEWLLQIIAEDIEVLDHKFDAWNISLPLHLSPAAFRSTLIRSAPRDILAYLTQLPTTMNNHEGGIEPRSFAANDRLTDFYDVLSLNYDRKGRPFVSTMEAKRYPIWGVQWHPEKNIYEWGIKDNAPFEEINHSRQAVRVAQWTANFFVDHARLNGHRYPDLKSEYDSLIYKHQTSMEFAPDFVQTYYFPEWPHVIAKPGRR